MLWLPGLDGTSTLWEPLRAALPACDPTLVRYAPDVARYDALLDAIAPLACPTCVVAESFGGPLAIRLAAREPNVTALVLIASFAVGPALARLGPLLRFAPSPPHLAMRLFMLGRDADDASVLALDRAIRSVPRPTIAARLAEVARVDVRAELRALRIPITWIVASRDRLVPAPIDVPSEIVQIDGPHLLAQARPNEVARVLRRVASRADRHRARRLQ